MVWLRWKFRQFKKWFRNYFLYRGYWKKFFNYESDKAHWEIINISEEKKITLCYIPEDDYSDKDIKIEVTHEQFEDLVKFVLEIR